MNASEGRGRRGRDGITERVKMQHPRVFVETDVHKMSLVSMKKQNRLMQNRCDVKQRQRVRRLG